MKKLSLIALATVLVVALGTGMALAATYGVTANFGIRVTEQGVSEQVGAVTIAASTGNQFTDGQIITPELLGNATISHTTVAIYSFAGAAPVLFDSAGATVVTRAQAEAWVAGAGLPAAANGYIVMAVEGEDYITVTIFANGGAFADGDQVRYGHEQASLICFDLEGTIYTASDPALQLVQVSYGDSLGNSFDGNTEVATVKAKSVVVALCNKTNNIDLIDLSTQAVDCGPATGMGDELCIEISDTASGSFQALVDYKLTLGNQSGGKAGVGIGEISDAVLWLTDSMAANAVQPGTTAVTRYSRTGQEIDVTDFTTDDNFTATDYLYAATAYVEVVFQFATGGPDTYTLSTDLWQDTCIITAGDYDLDLTFSKVPCGGSFTENDLTVATFVQPAFALQVFPYCVAGVGTWYNGLVVANPGTSAITVNFMIREADGDVYTADAQVAANGMAVGFAGDVFQNLATTSSDTAFGDEAYALYVTGTGQFYSFLFIANGTMAQGYTAIMP